MTEKALADARKRSKDRHREVKSQAAKRTHFKCGHKRTPENTAKMGNWTRCLTCKNEKNLAYMRWARNRCALVSVWREARIG